MSPTVNANSDFIGAKVALFLGGELLVILRDENRDIPWPGWWDFPGGGREPGETPEDVAIRETYEEVGLRLDPNDLRGKRAYTTSTGAMTYFFGAHLPQGASSEVLFGNEGQRCALWPVRAYMSHERAIPHFKTRLSAYLAERGHHER